MNKFSLRLTSQSGGENGSSDGISTLANVCRRLHREHAVTVDASEKPVQEWEVGDGVSVANDTQKLRGREWREAIHLSVEPGNLDPNTVIQAIREGCTGIFTIELQ